MEVDPTQLRQAADRVEPALEASGADGVSFDLSGDIGEDTLAAAMTAFATSWENGAGQMNAFLGLLLEHPVAQFEAGIRAAADDAATTFDKITSSVGLPSVPFIEPPRAVLAAMSAGRDLRDGACALLDGARDDVRPELGGRGSVTLTFQDIDA